MTYSGFQSNIGWIPEIDEVGGGFSSGNFSLNEHRQYTLPTYNSNKDNFDSTGYAIRTGDNGGLANGDGLVIYDASSPTNYDFIEGNYNLLIGTQVARNKGSSFQRSNFNFAIGKFAVADSDDSQYYTSIGHLAGNNASDFSRSVMVGYQAMRSTTGCLNSVAIGHEAIKNSSNCDYSIGIGPSALENSPNVDRSVCIGAFTGSNITTSSTTRLTAVGYFSFNDATGSCDLSTGIGQNSGSGSGGERNTFIGSLVGRKVSGNGNTLIGQSIGDAVTINVDNALVLRASDNTSIMTPESNKLLIGTDDSNILLRAGLASGFKTIEPGNDVEVGLGTTSKRFLDLHTEHWNIDQAIAPDLDDTRIIGTDAKRLNTIYSNALNMDGKSISNTSNGYAIYTDSTDELPRFATTSLNASISTIIQEETPTIYFATSSGTNKTTTGRVKLIKDLATGEVTILDTTTISAFIWNLTRSAGVLLTAFLNSNDNQYTLPTEFRPPVTRIGGSIDGLSNPLQCISYNTGQLGLVPKEEVNQTSTPFTYKLNYYTDA